MYVVAFTLACTVLSASKECYAGFELRASDRGHMLNLHMTYTTDMCFHWFVSYAWVEQTCSVDFGAERMCKGQ